MMAEKKSTRLPPGPRGLPFLGYLPYLVKEGGFARIAKKYGKILNSDFIMIDAKFAKVVIINSLEDIKEVFGNRDDYAFRTRVNMFTKFHENHQGFIFANGDLWKEHREFAMNALRDAGICRTHVERSLTEELNYVLKAMEATNEGSTDPRRMITEAVTNPICSIVFGKRYEYDDEEFVTLVESFDKVTREYGKSFFIRPWMKRLPKFIDFLGIPSQQKNMDDLFKFFQTKIDERAELSRDNIECYIDAFLNHGRAGNETFKDNQLLTCEMFDIFFASCETVRATLLWALNYMAKFPEIQARVQNELDENVGRDRLPKIEDKENLPYTNAVFMEVQRKATVTPNGAFHCNANEDVEIGEFFIPRGTYLGPNIYAVHHDPDVWEDPEHFNPNNFLNESDGTFKNEDHLIPYGYGRRRCLGSLVAHMEIFLFFTGCLHRFTVERTDPSELDGPPSAGIEHPSPFHVKFRRRK